MSLSLTSALNNSLRSLARGISFEVINKAGETVSLEASVGDQLWEILDDAGVGIKPMCGGNMACGGCHVHIDEAHFGAVGERDEDEE
ncbi:hypothetical protein KIPB_012202, partial [Kipferlia bialata]|eukprot:g12202.t1